MGIQTEVHDNKKAPCNRALFLCIQLQRLESPVASPLHSRQKAPRNQVLHRPAILNEPLLLLVINDL
ncbi:hypothetical protein BK781_15865 [Bacillus thuringiensis serovar aizawai]|nr:hypothetical protein BK781_15865 [Bacillus thuringiensis serovar aizawai]